MPRVVHGCTSVAERRDARERRAQIYAYLNAQIEQARSDANRPKVSRERLPHRDVPMSRRPGMAESDLRNDYQEKRHKYALFATPVSGLPG